MTAFFASLSFFNTWPRNFFIWSSENWWHYIWRIWRVRQNFESSKVKHSIRRWLNILCWVSSWKKFLRHPKGGHHDLSNWHGHLELSWCKSSDGNVSLHRFPVIIIHCSGWSTSMLSRPALKWSQGCIPNFTWSFSWKDFWCFVLNKYGTDDWKLLNFVLSSFAWIRNWLLRKPLSNFT